ncbi:poly(A) polymerase [Fusarium fujikuroi]|nr:poly(A) polymerase [Fusarium fujikuroi]
MEKSAAVTEPEPSSPVTVLTGETPEHHVTLPPYSGPSVPSSAGSAPASQATAAHKGPARFPGLPRVDYRLYSPPLFKLSNDYKTLSSRAEYLSAKPEALIALIRTQASVPPKPQIHIRGSRGRKVDFDIKLNLLSLLVPDDDNQRLDYIRCVGDGELAYRGGLKPDVLPEVGDAGLDEWCRHFIQDPASVKVFTLERVVTNLDTAWLEGQFRSLVAALNYRGVVDVSFVVTHSRVVIQNPDKVNQFFTSVTSLFSGKHKYEVVKAVWPFATAKNGEPDRRCIVQSEETWWREWRDPIKYAISQKRHGWVTVEDKLEALMEVDRLRSLYDKAYSAWPPHINLIYPFVEPEVLGNAAQALEGLVIQDRAHLALNVADCFKHKSRNTVFLGSDSESTTTELSKIRDIICNALGRSHRARNERFVPHMTIGQSEDASAAPHHFLLEKARLLAPIEWEVKEIAILIRDGALAQGGSGPRPMRLWGTLDLGLGIFRRMTPPQSFNDHLDRLSTIAFQPCYHSIQSSGVWETAESTNTSPDTNEVILEQLVVASYNVLAEFEWPPQSYRHPVLVENLLSAHAAADIVVLQEVTDHFLPDLLANKDIRSHYPFVTHGPPGHPGIGPLPSLLNTVILSRFEFEWHYLPFHRKHKGCTVARFPGIGTRDADDGKFKPWILVACHLSQGLTDGAVATKKKEVQKMLDYLSATFRQHPCIIAGDFNLATSTYTIDAAKKKNDISAQTVRQLRDIDRAISNSGFLDTWLATRLESGESSDIANEKRNVLDSFQGEQGATFDPLTNTLASDLVGNGLNNRPQRYDKILVRANGHYNPRGFNTFGQTAFDSPEKSGPTYASDHWGIRCLLVKSSPSDMSRCCVPEMKIALRQHPPGLANSESLEDFLEGHGCLPNERERTDRGEAIKTLEMVLTDATSSISENESRCGPAFIVVPVGSYGLGVWTSSSDIDCLCIGPFSSKTFFALAVQRLKRATTLGVRILRRVKANSGNMLELDINGIKVDLQYCAATSIAERWPEVMKRPASDPAFALSFQALAKLKPVRDLFYLRRSLPDMVQYRMAHLFIKSWAQARGIYSAKFGFLGGIHISVLLVPVCKALAYENETVTPADIVVTFFHHYSEFDWKNAMVFDSFFHKELTYNRTFREPLCLIGWHAPALNTAPVASIPTVATISSEFGRAKKLLSDDDCTWSKLLGIEPETALGSIQAPASTEFLHAFKTYIKIDAHYWGPSQEKSGRFIGWLESRCVMLLVDIHRKLKHLLARIWPSRFLDVSAGAETSGAEYHGCYLIGLAWDDDSNKKDAKEVGMVMQTVLQEFEVRIRRDEKYYDSQFCWMSATVARAHDLGSLEIDQSLWGEYGGETDDDGSDEELEEEEDFDDAEVDSKGHKSTGPRSRAAVVGKTPGLGKFRTAADVLNRLRWDPNFDSGDYIIGYEDRFLGARERAVEHWKTEQTDEEFIPQHRILYFKRREDNAIVWERRTRIDEIFGSGVKDR